MPACAVPPLPEGLNVMAYDLELKSLESKVFPWQILITQ